MNPVMRNRLIGLFIALAIFAADQYVKWLVVGPLDLRNQPDGVIGLLSFFDLRWTQNFGVSLGMFEATSMEMRWILVAVTAGIALVVTIWMLREKLFGDIFGLALILGGALGNIKDRFELGYVIDYADLHFGTFRPFLIFNIADAAITIGVVIILARSLFVRDKDAADTNEAGTNEAAAPAAES
jgi:signal peptidase II